MRQTGRIVAAIVLIFAIAAWHISYFLIDHRNSYEYFIVKRFIIYDFIYTPFLIPFVWWLGKQYDKAKFLAERDVLTGTYNRRYLLDNFGKIAAAAAKKRIKLRLTVIDINHFKSINDTFGHEIGDKVIQHIAKQMLLENPEGSIVSRWGGDEFVILAPVPMHEAGYDNNALASYKLSIPSTEGLEISIATGTAIYPDQAVEITHLISRADNNMYRQKTVDGPAAYHKRDRRRR